MPTLCTITLALPSLYLLFPLSFHSLTCPKNSLIPFSLSCSKNSFLPAFLLLFYLPHTHLNFTFHYVTSIFIDTLNSNLLERIYDYFLIKMPITPWLVSLWFWCYHKFTPCSASLILVRGNIIGSYLKGHESIAKNRKNTYMMIVICWVNVHLVIVWCIFKYFYLLYWVWQSSINHLNILPHIIMIFTWVLVRFGSY